MKRRLISGNLYNTVPKLVKLVSPLGIQQNYIIEKKYKQLSCRKVHILVKNTFLTITWRFDRFLLDNEM